MTAPLPPLDSLEASFQQSQPPDLNTLEKAYKASGPTQPQNYGLDDVILHGLTLGVNEKAAAAMNALKSLTQQGTGLGNFRQQYQDELQARLKAREAEMGKLGLYGKAEEMAAGAIPFAAGGQLAAPASYLGKLALAAGSGALGGGISGAANAPIGQELSQGAKGAIVGGATGAMIPSPEGGLISRTAQRALVGGGAGAAMGATLAGEGQRGAGAALGGVLGAATGGIIPLVGATARKVAESIPAVGKLADALRRSGVPTPVQGPQGKAEQIIKDYPGFAGKFAQIADRASQAADQGEAATLAQMGDREVLEHMTTQIAQRSPIARQGLIDFAQGQLKRAEPLYQHAYDQTFKVTPEMDDALQDPNIQKALEGAMTELKRAKVPLPGVTDVDPQQYNLGKFVASRIQAGAAGPVPGSAADKALTAYIEAEKNGSSLPIRVLDRAKQILDKTIWKSANDTDTLLRNRTTQHWLGTLLQQADQQVPEYGQARAIAATYKGVVQAANEAGKMATAKGILGPSARAAGDFTNPTGFEIASGLMGRMYGPAHYAIRTALAEGPSMKQYAVPLTKMLLTGSGGKFLGQDLGGAGDLAAMIERIAQPQMRSGLGPAILSATAGTAGSQLAP